MLTSPVAQASPWDERQAIVSRTRRTTDWRWRLGALLVSAAHVSASEEALVSAVTRYHATHPLEDGMPREEVRERVFARASPQVFDHVMRALTERKRIIARDRVALAGHSVALTDEEARARDAMIDILRESALAPPDPAALAARIGLPLEVVNRIATLLVRRSVLIRAGDLLFHESALARLKAEIQSLKQSGAAETIDVGIVQGSLQHHAQVRDSTAGVSRPRARHSTDRRHQEDPVSPHCFAARTRSGFSAFFLSTACIERTTLV